jgi:hypothetical protein
VKTKLTANELAEELTRWADMYGRPPIEENNIRIWYERRARNGFPDSAGVREDTPGRHRKPKVWITADVIAWYLTYEPSKGGRPRTRTG